VTLDGHGVWGWGENTRSLLGLGALGAGPRPTPEPILVDATSTFEASVGGLHACLLRRRTGMDDAILCAGSNDSFQLGMEPAPDPTHFTEVPGLP
jgi:alpha-tubulin suppressor-like RCC1 family protein